MEIFSERLKEIRKSAGMTQKQVAEVLNVRQQSYLRYEHGTGEPDLDTLVKLARLFEVSADYLLGMED